MGTANGNNRTMTNKPYYTEVDSWVSHTTQKDGSYQIVTVLKSDKLGPAQRITSSALPISTLCEISEQIRETLDCKVSWTQWDNKSKKMTTIPYESIGLIEIEYVANRPS